NDLCQMAVGVYNPPASVFDKAAVNIAKGATAAKVSARMFTAAKQFLSFPAFFPEARVDCLAQAVINPKHAWEWCMENLPVFREVLNTNGIMSFNTDNRRNRFAELVGSKKQNQKNWTDSGIFNSTPTFFRLYFRPK
ncbi:MAG: hypothetical protein IKR18_10330, partial [Bacteroidaceae bacterium]|nr:hypothetical protein [Bacteroidaceae bacterium]